MYGEIVHIIDYYFNQLIATARRRSETKQQQSLNVQKSPLRYVMSSSAVSSADSGIDDFPYIDYGDDLTTPIITARPFESYGPRKKPGGERLFLVKNGIITRKLGFCFWRFKLLYYLFSKNMK